MREKLAHSISELCAIGNFGRTSAYSAIKTGALRAVKLGRRTVVLDEDLRAFLKNLPEVTPKHSAKSKPASES
jgi:Helix-turn-helix domain